MTNQRMLMAAEERRNDLDWLRVIATFGVFLLHCLKFFDPLDWEVKNNVLSEGILVPILFLLQWLMPLFVALSGASIYLALRQKSTGRFIKARFMRILLPYLTVGLFLIIPPQEYVRYVSHGGHPVEGIYTLFIKYLLGMRVSGSGFPWLSLPQMHLWYLPWLFIFTLAVLPLLLCARRFARSVRAGVFLKKPGAVFLLCLPIALLLSNLDPSRPVGNLTSFGGWPLLSYPLFLVLGYCIVAIDGFEDALVRHRRTALVLAALSLPLFIVSALAMLKGRAFAFGTPGYLALSLIRAFNSWALLIAFLGFGMSALRFSNRFLKYASEATLPFYMIHQTIIVLIGYAIAGDTVHWAYKLVYLVILSFLTTAVTYDLLVRRTKLLRFFFGMKRKKPTWPVTSVALCIVTAFIILSPAVVQSAENRKFSGRIETGAAVFAISDHLSTDDDAYLDSLDGSARRHEKVTPAVFFRITYKDAGGSEAYFGMLYDIREVPLEAGLDTPLGNKSALKFNIRYIKDPVWKDPYLVGVRREETNYYNKSVSATYTRIGGSMLSLTYRFDRFDVTDDQLGLRFHDLKRDGIAHSLSVEYTFGPVRGVTISSTAGTGRNVIDGDANSADSVMAGLTLTRRIEDMDLRLSADTKYSIYKKSNPVFDKTIHATDTRILLTASQGNLFGCEKMFANIFAGFEYRKTNECFFDAQKLFSGFTIGYRF